MTGETPSPDEADEKVHARARIGDAPRWLVVPYLIGIFGPLTIFLTVTVGGGIAADAGVVAMGPVEAASSVMWLVCLVGIWSAHVVLFTRYQRRRPLDSVDRPYYRLALIFLTLVSFYSRTPWGLVTGLPLLVHTFVIDREVRQVEGVVPVTKRDRAVLTGEQPPRPRRRGFRRPRA